MSWIRDEDINKLIERMFKQMDFNTIESNDPNVRSWSYGYSMTIGPDGKPIIREWGTGLPEGPQPLTQQPYIAESTHEPLSQVDIDTEDKTVRVIVEMPGFTKESIRITGTENTLHLIADHETRHLDTEIPINARVDPKSAHATYRNGVLDIKITLLEAPKRDDVDIQIN
ncbi:Hsp20/alpha crystallin family protein [Thermoproteota archaeon]